MAPPERIQTIGCSAVGCLGHVPDHDAHVV